MLPKASPTPWPSPSPSPSKAPRQADKPSSSFDQFMDPHRGLPHPDYVFDANPVNPFTGKAAGTGNVTTMGQGGTSASAAVKDEGDGNGDAKVKGGTDGKEEEKEGEGGEESMTYEVEDEEEVREGRDEEDKENWQKGPYVTKSRLEVGEGRNENGGRDFYLRCG